MKLRAVDPKHKEWVPHGYQVRGIDHLCSRGSATLFLDPGMGKTAVALAAFLELQDAGIAQRMLVIAPMRVCQLVWRQEAAKWTQFRGLRIVNLAGKSADERKRLLQADADIWLINPESVPWLCDQFQFQRLPFDTVVIDELTKFKNSRAVRSKKLQPLMDKVARRWGLTGTPVPNGYMDLFGQMKIIDGGAALGKFITHFRDRFFQAGRDGFSYELKRGADKTIEALIEPYTFRAAADDYLTLPPLIPAPIELELPPKVREQYKQMKRDMLVQLEGQTITATNAAAVYNKLQQLAGGAMYSNSEQREFVTVHELKVDALIDLIDELQGQPLLVAYAYEHERIRINEALKAHFYGAKAGLMPDIPYLGGGVKGWRAEEIEQDWNAGKLPVLLAHPASAGHGLNMQLGGAAHLCWFTQTWDYELYDQFIRRIHRQGNSAERIVMHKIIVKETIDELVEDALESKATTQDALLTALKSELVKDDPNAATAFVTTIGANMRKLTSPGGAAPAQQTQQSAPQQTQAAAPRAWGQPQQSAPAPQAAPAAPQQAAQPAAPRGWGNKAPAQQAAPAPAPVQEPLPQEATTLFSPAVQEQFAEPGAVDPQWTGNAQGGDTVPFDGGQPILMEPPAKEAAQRATRSSKKSAAKVEVSSDLRITFDVGSYINGRLLSNTALTFEEAFNEAATIVGALRGDDE